MIDNIVDQLKRDEGLRLLPYRDSQGYMTIGYGHNLDAHSDHVDGVISEAQAEEWLKADLEETNLLLNQHIPWVWDMDVVRRGVLQNMCFNMGWGDERHGLSTFTTFLGLMKDEKWDLAAPHMLSSLWAREVKDRAVRLSVQVSKGEWQ